IAFLLTRSIRGLEKKLKAGVGKAPKKKAADVRVPEGSGVS
ncbi:ectoine/hydroxyectoine ABC transporter permease subunit EhuC, partial [Streptomyces sp. NPDC057062]